MLDHLRAALRWLPAAESSVDDGAGDTGSEREKGHAHRARKNVGKLEVVSSYRGAYWSELDCSPELLRRRGSRVVVVGVAVDHEKTNRKHCKMRKGTAVMRA